MTRSAVRRAVGAVFAATCLIGLGAGQASAAPTLSLGGPSQITGPGTYNYYATLSAPYNNFMWYVRFCNTSTVDSCSTTWNRRTGTEINPSTERYSQSLTRDCSSNARSFQVKVTANAFGVPAQTKYVVTKLCYPLEP